MTEIKLTQDHVNTLAKMNATRPYRDRLAGFTDKGEPVYVTAQEPPIDIRTYAYWMHKWQKGKAKP